MTEVFNDKLRVCGIILANISRSEKRWTPLVKETLRESPTPFKVQSALYWLLENGYIERPSRGVYRITGKGKEFLALLMKNN